MIAMFPYYSQEARQQLGLPDSPVLHLAITKLANALMLLAEGAQLDARIVRITALRSASSAALEQSPWACAAYRFSCDLGLPTDSAGSDEAFRTVRTDWLRAASAQIEAERLDPGPDTKRMATDYGWNGHPQPEPTPVKGPPRVVTDEIGRSWALPPDDDALFDLVNEYGLKHGRPSGAAHSAFRRHGQLETMYMLIMRGAEGERINLAARALALGPFPPLKRPLPNALPGLPAPEERFKRFAEAQVLRDEAHFADLRAEAEEAQGRGYAGHHTLDHH